MAKKTSSLPTVDCDPTDCIMDVRFEDKTKIGILVKLEDKAILSEALKRSRGKKVITQHLHDISVREPMWSNDLFLDAVIRSRDAAILSEALKRGCDAEFITLLLANAVCNALIVSKSHSDTMANCGEQMDSRENKRKLTKYRRGPESKKEKKERLKAAIIQANKNGTPMKPGPILNALKKRDDAEDVVYIKRKGKVTLGKDGKPKLISLRTIANILSEIKNDRGRTT